MESGRVFRWEGGHFWGDDWKRCPGRTGMVVGRWVISGEKGILSLDLFTMRVGNIFTVTLGDVLN